MPTELALPHGSPPVPSATSTLAGPTWYVVADGLGASESAHLASRLVTDAFSAASPDRHGAGRAVRTAETAVRRAARESGAVGMGASFVAAACSHGRIVVAHAGDARCYRLVDGRLAQLTGDHSVVRELVDLGRVSPADVASHPMRRVVTRSIGLGATGHDSTGHDIAEVPASTGRLLLASHAVGALPARTIGRVLAGIGDAAWAARRLVSLAGDDRGAAALVVDEGSMCR